MYRRRSGYADNPCLLMTPTLSSAAARACAGYPWLIFISAISTMPWKKGRWCWKFIFPYPPANTGGGFAKFERTAADLPIVNVATRISLDNAGICVDARVVAGAATLSGVPGRSAAAEAVLLNQAPDDALIETAAAASADIECIHDFRVSAQVRSLWVRCGIEDALKRAVEQARQGVEA